MDFTQNVDQPIITNDFPQNNIQPPIINDIPQNLNQPPMPTGFSQNFNDFNNINNYSPNINKPNNFPQNLNHNVNDHHINNYGYFYFEPNTFMRLENQQKINIIIITSPSPLRIIPFIIFSFLLAIGGALTGITAGALFPIPIVAFIGLIVSFICFIGCCKNCKDTYIYYNIENKNIEINLKKKMKINMDSIDKIKMEVDTKGSIFYIITKSGEKTEFLKLPLVNGVPFKEGEMILNDFIEYWKKKEGLSQTPDNYKNV